MKRFLVKLGIDRAITYVILARGWSVLSGLLTIFLIAKFLSPEEQGYYFAFMSVIAFQVVFELGLGSILTQFVSHEMGSLSIKNKKVYGDTQALGRLYSLCRLTLYWYSVIALLIIIILIPTGWYFFKGKSPGIEHYHVIAPWCALVISSAISLMINAFLSIGEGCGFVERIAKLRFYQSILTGLLTWWILIEHGGLYATIPTSLSSILLGGAWLSQFLFFLIKTAFKDNALFTSSISWKDEIFPMQWRIALSWLSGYFIFQLINPLAFKFFGAKFSGQLGMSISIINMMVTLSLAWITTKVPLFGNLISQKVNDVYSLYRKVFLQSVTFYILMILSATGLVFILNYFDFEIASRLLSPTYFLAICLAMLANHIVACQATFVRAHKVEIYTPLSIFTALILCISLYLACRSLQPCYLVIAYISVSWLVYAPGSKLVFYRFTKKYGYV